MVGPAREEEPPELWVPPSGRPELRALGARLGMPEMFEQTFRVREYAEQEPFRAAGLEVQALRLPHYTLETYGFRVSNGDRSLAYSGDCGPSDRLAELARDCDLFLCEATLERPELDGEPRGHLTAEEAVDAFRASGAERLVLTHRPHELPVDSGLELAYDGLEIDLT
jgi:ribonuclease BN (tRNA processing enzyme)